MSRVGKGNTVGDDNSTTQRTPGRLPADMMTLADVEALVPNPDHDGFASFGVVKFVRQQQDGLAELASTDAVIYLLPRKHPTELTRVPEWQRWLATYSYGRPAIALRAADFPDESLVKLIDSAALEWPTDGRERPKGEPEILILNPAFEGILTLFVWACAREGMTTVVLPREDFLHIASHIAIEALLEAQRRQGVVVAYHAGRVGMMGGIGGALHTWIARYKRVMPAEAEAE